jgi:hypothetical protein
MVNESVPESRKGTPYYSLALRSDWPSLTAAIAPWIRSSLAILIALEIRIVKIVVWLDLMWSDCVACGG